MKKMLFGGIFAVLVVAFALITPYYLGGKAQQSLEIQHRALADTFFFDVKSHNYERGWFSSTETTVLRFHPSVLANLGHQLPDNIRIILEHPITMINYINHQPFANGIVPVSAVVTTQFQYDAETEKTLKRFFGDQVPLTLHNVINWDGSGQMQVSVAPFDYEELSGIKLNWRGLTGQVDYTDQFSTFNTHFIAPQLTVRLADKGNINLEKLDVNTETYLASNGKTALGSSKMKLNQFEIVWHEGMDYNLHLNDLINMVTDLQIGAFINPNGTIAPNKISVQQLSYSTQTTEPETGFINSKGIFAFNKLDYGNEKYGPLNIDISAEHIHADSLYALKTRWQQIIAESQNNQETQQDKLLAAVRKEGVGIFTHNPLFKLNAFSFTAPTGHIRATGNLGFNGVQATDLNDIKPLIAKMKAELDLDVSQNMIENFAVSQMRSLFAVEDPNNAQEAQEIDETIKLLAQQTLDTMSQEGYIQKDNDAIKTRLIVENNSISLNNKPFETTSDDDLFYDGLDDDNATPPQPELASQAK